VKIRVFVAKKRIYLSGKTYIPFGQNVYTFWGNGIYLLGKKAANFFSTILFVFLHLNIHRPKGHKKVKK
jgi:hypothetical protein